MPAGGFKEAFRADFPKRNKSRKGYRKPPASIYFAAIVAMLMSAMYLFKAFSFMPQAIEENDFQKVAIAFGFVLLFFVMFVRFVIALFRLSSGSRKAWATTERMAITYLALLAISRSGIVEISSDIVIGAVTIPWWIMAVVMSALIVYMLLPRIRDYFTPAYAETAGLFSWILYIFGLDPFRKGRMAVK